MRPRTLIFVLGMIALGVSPAAAEPGPSPDDLQSGIALFEQGKYAQAEAALRKAAGPDAQAYLAASLAKQKRYAEAEAPAKAAVEAAPTHEVGIGALGESLVGQKKFDEAVKRMTAALGKSERPSAYLWRGQAYQHQKETARMVVDYETFLKLAPKAPEAPAIRAILASLK